MKHGSLFSGIGGFDLAADWMGWENVFHCEWEDFPRKVLHHYWPNAISYGDITKTDFTIHRGTIDILSGGFPCQPYSQAGKRLGKEDERHLWPHMLRAIREIQPRWVVGENVLGLVNWNDGLVFEEVCADLESEGYEVQPFILPAAGVNAPHQRYRVWFVAYNDRHRCAGSATKRNDKKCDNKRVKERGEYTTHCDVDRIANDVRPTFNSDQRGYSAGREEETKTNGIPGKCGPKMDSRNFDGTDIPRPTSDTESQQGERLRPKQRKNSESEQGKFRRISGKDGSKQPSRLLLTDWEEFPTQSPVCIRNDGISGKLDGITFSKWRTESIKAYGNAVVPQVVLQIFKAIEQYKNLTK